MNAVELTKALREMGKVWVERGEVGMTAVIRLDEHPTKGKRITLKTLSNELVAELFPEIPALPNADDIEGVRQ